MRWKLQKHQGTTSLRRRHVSACGLHRGHCTKQFVFLLWSHFSEGENFFLLDEHPLRAFLYILQKICLEHPPGRPTVSGIGNATERISGFVEFHINNLN